MRTLQINASYKPAYIYGGPTMSVSKLTEELVKAGHKADVFTTTANGADELPVIIGQPVLVDGVAITYFKRITKDHSHFSPQLLYAVWKNAKHYDVIHIHAWWNLVSVLSCLIAVVRNVPVLVSPRGTLSNYSFLNNSVLLKKILHQTLGIYLLKRSHLHATSRAEELALLKIIKPKTINVIPNFVKLAGKNYNNPVKDNNVLKLLFFSRIEQKKGLDLLIGGLPKISIPYHLTIAGDGDVGYINRLKKLAKDNGSSSHINWAGFITEDKFALLHEHDLLVLPSYDENFGNVIIESLSVGTAVLISEKVGLADYIAGQNLGWIRHASSAAISEAINRIGTQREALERIRQDAPAIIRRDFNEAALVKRYLNLYKEIII